MTAEITTAERVAAQRGVPEGDVAAYRAAQEAAGFGVLPVRVWAEAAGHDLPSAEAYETAQIPQGVLVSWLMYARLHDRDGGGKPWPGVV